MTSKDFLRKEILLKMNSLPPSYVSYSSDIVCKKIILHIKKYDIRNIIAYRNIGNELNLDKALNYAWNNNINTYFPKIKNKTMEFYQAYKDDFIKGYYNILEPSSDNVINYNYYNDKKTLILVPAIGVNLKKYRLGRGGGYYDKYFCDKNVSCKIIGIIYNFTNKLDFYETNNDIKFDELITD